MSDSHYEDAESIAESAIADSSTTDSDALAAAQVKATLALADAITDLRLLIADRT